MSYLQISPPGVSMIPPGVGALVVTGVSAGSTGGSWTPGVTFAASSAAAAGGRGFSLSSGLVVSLSSLAFWSME